MKRYLARFNALLTQIKIQYISLSGRERSLIIIVVLGAVIWIMFSSGEWISARFNQQTVRLELLREWEKFLPSRIVTYKTLQKRRLDIEERFKSAGSQGGIPTYVEGLFSEKIGAKGSNLQISNQPQAPLGEGFVQTPFSVRFQTTDVEALVNFLKELTHGKQPLIVSEIELAKTYSGDRVEVGLKISSVRQKAAQDA